MNAYLNFCLGGYHVLRVHLCADEVVLVSIDVRTGRMNLRDTGDLAAASRGPRFAAISDRLNENPGMLLEALVRLRFNVSQKKKYDCHESLMRFVNHRRSWTSSSRRQATSACKSSDIAISQKRVCVPVPSSLSSNKLTCSSELQKLGSLARGTMYIKLSNFPFHYLVLVITEEDFRYALISVKVLPDSMFGNMIMEDIGWLDVRRIRGEKGPSEVVVGPRVEDPQVGQKRKRDVASSAQNTLRGQDK